MTISQPVSTAVFLARHHPPVILLPTTSQETWMGFKCLIQRSQCVRVGMGVILALQGQEQCCGQEVMALDE